jgi:hypothetical protein
MGMSNFKRFIVVMAALALAALACNLNTAGQTPEPPGEPAGDSPTVTDEPTIQPTVEPTAAPVTAEDVCLPTGADGTQYINQAGGYCFLLPEGYTITQDSGLDIFVAGPLLATFGQEGLSLAFGFSVLGAPGDAGDFDAQSWGEQVVAENSSPGFELNVEPYTLTGAGLDGVRVGPMPGMATAAEVFVRTNDTLYGVTVYPERSSFPEYTDQVDTLWAQLSDSIRFFPPVDTGVDYQTAGEVCPTQGPDTQLIVDYTEGWCVLIPSSWHEDVENQFLGRFVGGPEIGVFWPGQPAYANVTVGYSGPVGDLTLDQQVEASSNANGRPDLVQRTDATIGGFPAVILDRQDGPIPDRVALIHANGGQYSVLGQPFDAENFPTAQPDLEAAWDVMINSIQFFEAYR